MSAFAFLSGILWNVSFLVYVAASAWPWLSFNHLIGRFVEIAVVFFCELLYCACCIVCALDISVVVTNQELHKVMVCVSC